MAEESTQSISPNEDEEFEFRARAEQEARARQSAETQLSSGPSAEQQAAQQAEDAKNKPLTPTEAVVGGAQTAYNVAQEHPVVAGAAALGAGKLLSNVPGVGSTASAVGRAVIPGYNLASGAVNAANQFVQGYGERNAISSFNTLLNNYTKMQSDARQYVKAGQAVPQELTNAIKNLGSQINAVQSKIPSAAAEATQVAGNVAAEQPGVMSRLGQLASRYGPVLEKIGKLGGVGGQALFHSGGLNANEDEELRKRRALGYVNPNGTNAINSGFSNQLNSLSNRQ